MVIEMAIFSSQSAENRLLFMSLHSWESYSGPNRSTIVSTTSPDLNMSSTRSSM
jgi:hypothetical protein